MTAFWFVLVLAMQQEPTCLAPLVDSQRVQQRAEVRDAANAVCTYFNSWHASDYQDARARSAEAVRRNPNNPIAHYLVGLLAIRGRDLRVPGLTGHFLRAGYTQTNAELEARRALERALAVDERFGDASRALAELAIYLPTPQNLEIADRATGEFLSMQVTLADVTPGVNDLRIILRNTNTPDIGLGKSVVHILPDLGTSQLSISDIVLAEQPTGSYRRGAISLALRPTHQFAQGQEFTLFYELHGLAPATPYRTNVELVREPGELAKLAGKRGDTRFAADFRDTGPQTSGTIQQLRRIQSNLTPGVYLVRVTVAAGREKIVRETTLKVVESGNR